MVLEQEVLSIFQKDNSLDPHDFPIEFFLGFFKIVDGRPMRLINEPQYFKIIFAPLNVTFIQVN